ncbi:MAG TPA: ABC transporter substrate-binding protein [Burkholderiales bacterium]|nr:ABC transporter substrate-binding protein [Burkholderiales bacterium]
MTVMRLVRTRARALRTLAISAALLCVAPPYAAARHTAAHGGAIPRIGFLSLTVPSKNEAGLTERLAQLGYREGENIVIERVYANGNQELLDREAQRLVASGVALLYAVSPPGAIAARKATSTVPIVFSSISNPVGMGLAKSLVHPGGNITGVANMPADLNIKRLEMLRDAFPQMRRVALITRSGNPNHQVNIAAQVAAARRLGFEPTVFDLESPTQFEGAFQSMARDGVEAACAVQDTLFFAAREHYMKAALRWRIPVIADGHEYAEAGALIAYGVDYRRLYLAGANYVDKILKGADPGTLPIEQPMQLNLVVNVRTSRLLGAPIPRALLVRADRIIE